MGGVERGEAVVRMYCMREEWKTIITRKDMKEVELFGRRRKEWWKQWDGTKEGHQGVWIQAKQITHMYRTVIMKPVMLQTIYNKEKIEKAYEEGSTPI